MEKKIFNHSFGLIIKHGLFIRGLLLLVVSALTVPSQLYANPQDGQVVGGAATIAQETATKLGITQHTDKTIINWKSFNIDTKEHTQFYQPAESSVALNRIVGSDNPSRILGQLTANGRIFLVNPNGVVFGHTARVDVAALVASTQDIKNSDFMAGRFDFTIPGNPKASIINQGNISVADKGLVAFVAPGVQNSGVIAARLGNVQLASANGFTLDLYGDELVRFMVDEKVASYALDADGNPMDALVDNTGMINADGGYVLLTADAAREVVNKVVNSSGVIEARSVEQQAGEIVLHGGDYGIVSVSGALDVSGKHIGEAGGRVQVTGEKVGLFAGANVDVSGDMGGGTALIGGDYLGGAADSETVATLGVAMESVAIPNAQFAYVDEAANISANALTSGDGGKIVVWADQTTRAAGNISANAGPNSGDGGFIEVSGKQYLDINGIDVSASANAGKAGTVLFDPGDVVIGKPSQASATYSLTPFVSRAAVGTTTYISSSNVEYFLNRGTSVVIKGTAEGPNVDSKGDITVADSIKKTRGGDVQFSLFAADRIIVDPGVSITSRWNKLNIYLDSDYDRHTYGLIQLSEGSEIKTNGGFLILNGSEIQTLGKIKLERFGDDIDSGLIHRMHIYETIKTEKYIRADPKDDEIFNEIKKYIENGARGPAIIAAGNYKLSTDEVKILKKAETLREGPVKVVDNYSKDVALECALLSVQAYTESTLMAQWLSDRGYKYINGIHDDNGNDAYLAKSKTVGGVENYVVAIRGTETVVDGDIMRDLSTKGTKKSDLKGKVHPGFYGLAADVMQLIENEKDLLKKLKAGKAKITITGHSLGGAAATLLSAMLYEENVGKKNMQTYTYGAPTVGDSTFANEYSGKLNVQRFYDPHDPVVKVGPTKDGTVGGLKGVGREGTKGAIGAIGEGTKGAIGAMAKGAIGAIGAIGEGTIGAIGEGTIGAIGAIGEGTIGAIGAIGEGTIGAIGAIGEGAKDAKSAIGAGAKDAKSAIGGIGEGAKSGIGEGAKSAFKTESIGKHIGVEHKIGYSTNSPHVSDHFMITNYLNSIVAGYIK